MSNPVQQYRFVEFIQILDKLTDREKTILIRCDFEGKTHAEIGKEFRLTAARISQLTARARRRVSTSLLNYIHIKKAFEDKEARIRLLEYKLANAESILAEQGKPIPTAEEIDATTLEDLDLSVRLYNVLKSHKINIVAEIRDVGNEILGWRDFGKKTYIELRVIMKSIGIKWPVNEPQLF